MIDLRNCHNVLWEKEDKQMCVDVYLQVWDENNYYSISMDTYEYVCSSKCKCIYIQMCALRVCCFVFCQFVVVLM